MLSDFLLKRLRRLGVAVMMAAWAASVLAKDEGRPDFSLRGFGSLGAVYHNADGVKFRRDISQAGGAQAGQVSLAQDSMLGVQLTAYLNEQFEASSQALSRLTADNNFEPQLTWAYLKYKPLEEIGVRVGRLGVESYPQGDSAEIGYANLQIRQPVIYYPRIFDGIDAETTHPVGGGTVRLKGSAGWAQGELVNLGSVYDTGGSELIGGALEYARNGWTGRVSYFRMRTHDEIDELKQGALFRTVLNAVPNGARIIDALSMSKRVFNNSSAALAYDSGPLQGIASYSVISTAHWPAHHLFYANLGYRLGEVTPYLSYSRQRSSREFIPTGIPDGIGYDELNRVAAVAQTGFMTNQSDVAVGARYDFTEHMALKFQIDRFRYRDPVGIVDAGLLAQPAENRGARSLTVFSLALDFVF